MKRIAILTGVFLGGAVAGHFALRLLVAFARWLEDGYQPFGLLVWELARLAIPLLAGWLLTRWAARHVDAVAYKAQAQPPRPRLSFARTATTLLAAGYLVTWAIGVPAISTHLVNNTVAGFRQLYDQTGWPVPTKVYPEIRINVALPIAPGVVAVLYEAAIGGQAGWGGWVVYLWWGTGQKELKTSYLWLS